MNILVIRFSAVGDLVISFPYLLELLNKKSDHHIYLATKEQMLRFIPEHPRLHPVPLSRKSQKKGITALIGYFFRLKKSNIDCVVDLHNNLRSNILLNLFRLTKAKIFQLDKNRGEKKKLTRSENKIRTQLPYVGMIYKQLLEYGTRTTLSDYPCVDLLRYYPADYEVPARIKGKKIIGVAPFAAHELKIYPLDYMRLVIERLYENPDIAIAFFCFGKNEVSIVNSWARNHKDRTLFSSDLGSFAEELYLMQQSDLILTMDSANLHFASLTKTTTLSVWGPTNKSLGFIPLREHRLHQVEIPFSELSCRPCSVFGNKNCTNPERHACMKRISPDAIVKKIYSLI